MTPNEIIDLVCHEFGVSHQQFFSRTRKREVIYARQAATKIIKDRNQQLLSLEQIGRIIAGNDSAPYDHTTVRNSVIRANADYKLVDEYKEKVDAVLSLLPSPEITPENEEYLKVLKGLSKKEIVPFTSLKFKPQPICHITSR